IGVHRGNTAIGRSDVEGRVEVLRHGADVTRGWILLVVAPRADGKAGDSLEDLLGIDRDDVVLCIAIADGTCPVRCAILGPRRHGLAAAARPVATARQLCARGGCRRARRRAAIRTPGVDTDVVQLTTDEIAGTASIGVAVGRRGAAAVDQGIVTTAGAVTAREARWAVALLIALHVRRATVLAAGVVAVASRCAVRKAGRTAIRIGGCPDVGAV